MPRSKVKSRSCHDVAHLHPQLMSLPSINILHLMVSEKQPGQDFFPAACPPDSVTAQLTSQMPWMKTIPILPLKTMG